MLQHVVLQLDNGVLLLKLVVLQLAHPSHAAGSLVHRMMQHGVLQLNNAADHGMLQNAHSVTCRQVCTHTHRHTHTYMA